jgi:hypothetical protein
MGSCSLQHIKDRRSTSRRPSVPASFRPQGLATLSTACSLRTRAGFVSCRRRSWDSPFGAFSARTGAAAFPRPTAPHAVLPTTAPAAETAGRCDRPRLPGFDPFERPSRRQRVEHCRPPDAPLGFALPRLADVRLREDFAPRPPARLGHGRFRRTAAPCASEYQSAYA